MHAGPQGSSRGGEASKDVKSLKLFPFPGLKEQREEMVLSEKVRIWGCGGAFGPDLHSWMATATAEETLK